jgi:hypothetical protein
MDEARKLAGMGGNAAQQGATSPSYGGAAANNGYQAAMMQPQVYGQPFNPMQQPQQNALAQMQPPPQYQNALNVADFLNPVQVNALSRRIT